MNRALMDFCGTVKDGPSRPLETLLKVAETKNALLNWEQAIALQPAPDDRDKEDRDEDVDSIATAISLALGHLERAEETILDAFCLSQQSQIASKVQIA